jgi:hypothetical protein
MGRGKVTQPITLHQFTIMAHTFLLTKLIPIPSLQTPTSLKAITPMCGLQVMLRLSGENVKVVNAV